MVNGLYCLLVMLFGWSDRNKDAVTKVVVYKVELGIQTITKIDCEDFGEQFANLIDTINLDGKQIEYLEHALKKVRKASSKYSVDTRAKVHIYYASGRNDLLCLGSTSIFSFNGAIKEFQGRELIEFFWDLPKM